jgi:hypothetical protein
VRDLGPLNLSKEVQLLFQSGQLGLKSLTVLCGNEGPAVEMREVPALPSRLVAVDDEVAIRHTRRDKLSSRSKQPTP